MAITGQCMVLFAIVHVLGNSSIFMGPNGGLINAYAEHLHAFPPLVWVFRVVMLVLLCIHVFYGITLTLENSAATPANYAVKRHLKANFASENMIWTGLIMLAFIIFHILHFTVKLSSLGVAEGTDALGRADVGTMVITAFHNAGYAAIYIVAMIALFLHVSHGFQSFFQTVGLNNDRTQCCFTGIGKLVAFIVAIGFISIPALILCRFI